MKKKTDALKILLLQIRTDETTLKEELNEFSVFSGLKKSQFTTINAFKNRHFQPSVIQGFDALFVGGSSDASVLDPVTYDFIPSCQQLLRHCYEKNIPTLASCFGFQLATQEFGGTVILDKKKMEMGLYQLQLTPHAKQDPLLYDCPNLFWTVSGHKERALSLPPSALLLGFTPLCPNHIFTFPNKPFYAFQFHPEVSKNDLVNRIKRYKNRYLSNESALESIIKSAIHETTESNLLIRKFIERMM